MRKTALVFLMVFILLLAFVGCSQDPEHIHTFSTDWTHDESYHWHEPTCGHDVISGKAEHSWDEGSVTTEATHTTDGVKTFTCMVCAATRTEAIPARSDAHTYAKEWTADETHHWHPATCKHDVKDSVAEHVWSKWTVIRPATYSAEGEESRSCTVCGRTETRVIKLTGGSLVISDDIIKTPVILLECESSMSVGAEIVASATVTNISAPFDYHWNRDGLIDFSAFIQSTDGMVNDETVSFSEVGSHVVSLYVMKDGIIWNEEVTITVKK